MIGYEKQVYITEKLLFRFLMAHPLPIYKKDQEKLWSQYQKDIMRIRQDKYEKQLLKTFDFTAWIESKLTNIPVANRLVYIGKTVIQGIISVIYLQREKEYMPTFVKKSMQ